MGTISSPILIRYRSDNKSNPTLSASYGPYANVAAAHAALAEDGLNVVGMTVGIKTGDTIEEYWYQGGTAQSNLVPKKPTLATVATSGSYNDLTNKPTIPAPVDISGKADKSEMSITPGTGANADKTTIQLKSGTTATVLTQHQDISGKANTSDMNTALGNKQDTIQDLATIRSGAALGATAKQPAATLAGYGIIDAYTKQEVNNLVSTPHQNYGTVADYASLPASGSADTIYRVSNWDGTDVDASKYAEYAWDGSQYVLLSVKSAVDEIFDISAYTNKGYETLSAALEDVPAAIKKGGMDIKFTKTDTTSKYGIAYSTSSGSVADATNIDYPFTIADGNSYIANDIISVIGDSLDRDRVETAINSLVNDGAIAIIQCEIEEAPDQYHLPTYGVWTITKNITVKRKYVKYSLTSATWSTNVANWQGVDDEPIAGSENLVKSSGVYADTHLCNVQQVNDFVVDIVLKEGVDDPEGSQYIDFDSVSKICIYSCESFENEYINMLQVVINSSYKTLFMKKYNTLEESKADLGKLINGARCYCVLRDVGSYHITINTTLTFNRDVTWKSLNEHPVIKELLIEQGVEEEMAAIEKKVDYSYDNINGYDEKIIDELLTDGKYWHHTVHERGTRSGYVSNDVTSCNGGDVFIITGTGGSSGNSRLYVFTDADGNNIDGAVAEVSEVREDYTLVAPEGAVRFYFTARSAYPYKLQKQSSYEGILNELAGLHDDIGDLSASVGHGEAAYDVIVGEDTDANAIELESGYWYVKNTPPIKGNATGWYRNPADSVPCEPGDKFILTGEGGSDAGNGPNSRLWAFANSNGELTRYAEVKEKHVSPYEVEAQEGEVRFYMSSRDVTPTLFKKSVTKGLAKKVSDLETAVSGIVDDIADIEESIDNSVHSVSRMFNVPLNLKKPNLKILDLGNSYTGDAIHYLANILNAAGITTGFSLYDCIRGGSCFRDWVNMYKETDDANYSVNKVSGDKINGITTGGNSGLDNSWFVSLLKNDWDIIIIHQESKHSGNYDGWTSEGDAGGLNEYLRILRTYCPQATIGFYIVHSYPSWKSSGYQAGADSTERWQNIAKSVERLKADYGIDFIIPYGTAVQNLRMTSLNGTDPVDNTKKNDFSADGTHLNSGIGDYVAACAYFEALFAPRYNVTVFGNTYTNTNVPVPQPGDSDYYDGRGVPVQITTANALLAQKAAVLAVNDMFNLHNPEIEGFIPVNTDTKVVYTGDGNPSGFITKSVDDLTNYYLKSETYTKAEVDALIAQLTSRIAALEGNN